MLDAKELNLVWEGSCHQKQINAIVNVENDIWTASDDATIAVWSIAKSDDVVNVQHIMRNTCGIEKILSMSLAYEKTIVSGSYSEILLWDTVSRRCIQEVKNAHKDQIPVLIGVGQLSVWSGSLSVDGSICSWAKNQYCTSGSEFMESDVISKTQQLAPRNSFTTHAKTDSKLSHPSIQIVQTH